MLSHLLSPRPDVLSGRIQGVIDPDRITDSKKKSLESKPLDFARATYVSADVRRLVKALHVRLNSAEAEVGTVLFEGPKGQGKSHLVTLGYHLVAHHAELSEWLAEQQLELSIPGNVVVVLRKFTDLPIEALWDVIAVEIGYTGGPERLRNKEHFRAALTGRKLVLLFDELESGVRAIADDARRQANVNFLQMISEESMRSDSNVVLVASVYDGSIEPGLTIKRVKPAEIRFSDSHDRLRILYHRLFATSPHAASPEIDTIVKSYVNTWQRFGIPAGTDYADRLRESYPFTPELLDVVLQRIPQSRGGFQGTRGALGFLAALVRLRGSQTNLLTLSDVALGDAEVRTWLADLEPSLSLISCADANLRELAKLPLADRIASATLIASLAPSRNPGITEDDLSRQVIDPPADYNQFRQTLEGFTKYASYFHRRDQNLFFDTRENAHAKVELRSLSVQDGEAWDRVSQWWRNDVLGESDAVILHDVDLARSRLDTLQTDGLRFVISPRRLTAEDRHALYFGLKRRNTVVLLEPRDDKTNLRTNKDILAWVRKAIAAEVLATAAGTDAEKVKEFTRIAADRKKEVTDAIRRVNYAYVQVHHAGASASENEYSLEPIQPLTKDAVLQHLSRNLYPSAFIAEHIQNRASDLLGRKVSALEIEYRNTLSFPVITSVGGFRDAILGLVRDGVFNLNSSAGVQHAGEIPALGDQELMDAVLAAPSARPVTATRRPQPTVPVPTAQSVSQGSFAESADILGGGASDFGGSTEQQIPTPVCLSRQQLRQEVAAKLDTVPGRTIIRVSIKMEFDPRSAEMSTLPTFLRGSLAGSGVFRGEVALDFPGSFTKAAVEDMVERLPDFAPGSAKVTLTLGA